MGKRGRPKKKSTPTNGISPTSKQQTLPVSWHTKKEDSNTNNIIQQQKKFKLTHISGRDFKTNSFVFIDIPKFELTSQVPLYNDSNNPSSIIDGKVPLEEWTTNELYLLREELIALQTRMNKTKYILEKESKHLQALREQNNYPIHCISEQNCIGNDDYKKKSTTNGNKLSSGLGSFGKLQQTLIDKETKLKLKNKKNIIPNGLLPTTGIGDFINKMDIDNFDKPDTIVQKQPRETTSLPLPTVPDIHIEEVLQESPKPKRRSATRKKKQFNTKKSADQKRRLKRKKRKQIEIESSDEDDLLPKPISNTPLLTSAEFWPTMEPYICPFNTVDLKNLEPVNYPSVNVPIPPLGKHYSLVFQDKGIESTKTVTSNELSCGDLTQRLLSSMLEVEAPTDLGFLPDVNQNCLPLDIPPTADYNQHKMESLEDRICMELKYIGLLDDDVNLARREDDEICSEIRLLQKQLKERIASNNEKRLKFYKLVKKNMENNANELLKGSENRTVELIYERKKTKTKGRRRSKGRPRGRPPLTPVTESLPSTPSSNSLPFSGSPPSKKPRATFQNIPLKAPLSHSNTNETQNNMDIDT